MKRNSTRPFTVAVLCGGPSAERGISLNSARSVCDHLESESVAVVPVYFDQRLRPFRISRGQLYSNTPADFDFKLEKDSRPMDLTQLRELLVSCDLVFPAIHGRFGEDGELQQLLESFGCPYVGPPSKACRAGFDKLAARSRLSDAGFFTLPSLALEPERPDSLQRLEFFFAEHGLARAVVKPARGGSSIGVHSVRTPAEALRVADSLFAEGLDTRVLVEPFCEGAEFTVVVLQNESEQPVALVPIEIEMDYAGQEIFDYRKKYLATRQVAYHTPPRFERGVIQEIRRLAQEIFRLFEFKDFVRLDGWALKTGQILFSDINPISGMEQNSFMFIQAAEMGLSHRDTLAYILRRSARRQGIGFPDPAAEDSEIPRETVHVLFGGDTAERHVSIMSGTNVWLKLARSARYRPVPFLLDLDGSVWRIPYPLCLYHTVEEISELCRTATRREARMEEFRGEIVARLNPAAGESSVTSFTPRRLTLEEFIAESRCVFIALHGGIGENGGLQSMLAQSGVAFTGSDAAASRLCIDKDSTGQALQGLQGEGIHSFPKRVDDLEDLLGMSTAQLEDYWERAGRELEARSLIVKPSDDGCSAGVARLENASDLAAYLGFVREGAPRIPPDSLTRQPNIIELPPHRPRRLLFERFAETCRIEIRDHQIVLHTEECPWVEVTVGVLGRRGSMRAMSPSVTVAESAVLSLEEKFQGGTGVNITPPPPEFVLPAAVEAARRRVERVAEVLGVSGFARIDAFLNAKNGEIIVIEANTIPGLTPSTVIYHQALAEPEPMDPREFLEKILEFRTLATGA